jgi:hypothetical protein
MNLNQELFTAVAFLEIAYCGNGNPHPELPPDVMKSITEACRWMRVDIGDGRATQRVESRQPCVVVTNKRKLTKIPDDFLYANRVVKEVRFQGCGSVTTIGREVLMHCPKLMHIDFADMKNVVDIDRNFLEYTPATVQYTCFRNAVFRTVHHELSKTSIQLHPTVNPFHVHVKVCGVIHTSVGNFEVFFTASAMLIAGAHATTLPISKVRKIHLISFCIYRLSMGDLTEEQRCLCMEGSLERIEVHFTHGMAINYLVSVVEANMRKKHGRVDAMPSDSDDEASPSPRTQPMPASP